MSQDLGPLAPKKGASPHGVSDAIRDAATKLPDSEKGKVYWVSRIEVELSNPNIREFRVELQPGG